MLPFTKEKRPPLTVPSVAVTAFTAMSKGRGIQEGRESLYHLGLFHCLDLTPHLLLNHLLILRDEMFFLAPTPLLMALGLESSCSSHTAPGSSRCRLA